MNKNKQVEQALNIAMLDMWTAEEKRWLRDFIAKSEDELEKGNPTLDQILGLE